MKAITKKIIPLTISATILSSFVPVTAFASQLNNEKYSAINESKSTKINLDLLIIETSQSILNDALTHNNISSNKNDTRGIESVLAKLARKFGGHYIKKTLPKKIYAAVIKAVPSVAVKVSEDKFVGFFNTYILMGPLDDIHDGVTDYLDKYIPHWLASSAGYVVQGIIYALI